MNRKSRLILGALALAAALVFSACEQPAPTVSNKVQTVLANVKGFVTDFDGTPVAGATIVYDSPDGVDWSTTTPAAKAITSRTTNADGMFSLDGLATGTYWVLVTPPSKTSGTTTTRSHLVARVKVEVPDVKTALIMPIGGADFPGSGGVSVTDRFAEGSNLYVTMSQNMVLPKLGGSITGTLYRSSTVVGSQREPVAAKKVVYAVPAYADVEFLYPRYDSAAKAFVNEGTISTTTDANSVFTFADFPCMNYTPSLSLSVVLDDRVAEFSYPGTQLGVNGLPAAYVAAAPIRVADALTLPKLDLVTYSFIDAYGNNGNVALDANIVLTFNNSLVNKYAEQAKILEAGKPIAATVTVSGTTITIDPAENLAYGRTYTVNYVATDGKTTLSTPATAPTFATVQNPTAPVAIANLALDTAKTPKYDSSVRIYPDVTFAFNPLYKYNAYYKKSTDAAWTSLGTVTPSNVNAAGAAYARLGAISFESGETLQLKVRAMLKDLSNDLFADSNVITIVDTIAPLGFTVSTGASGSADYQPATATVAGYRNFYLYLDNYEIMNALPTSTFSATAPATLAATWTWVNKYGYAAGDHVVAQCTVAIPANTTLAGDLNIKASDAAGNAYDDDPLTAAVIEDFVQPLL